MSRIEELNIQPGDWVEDEIHGLVQVHRYPGINEYDDRYYYNSDMGYTFIEKKDERGYYWSQQNFIIGKVPQEIAEKYQLMQALR